MHVQDKATSSITYIHTQGAEQSTNISLFWENKTKKLAKKDNGVS